MFFIIKIFKYFPQITMNEIYDYYYSELFNVFSFVETK